jgi:hypothetical protein
MCNKRVFRASHLAFVTSEAHEDKDSCISGLARLDGLLYPQLEAPFFQDDLSVFLRRLYSVREDTKNGVYR